MKMYKVIMLLLASLLLFSCKDSEKKTAQEIKEELDDVAARHKAELEKEFSENGYISAETDARHNKEALRKIEEVSENASGDQAKALKAVAIAGKKADEKHAEILAPNPALDDAFDESNITTKKDIDDKILAIVSYRKQCESYLDFVEHGFSEILRESLLDQGVKANKVKIMMRLIKPKLKRHHDLIIEYQKCTLNQLKAMEMQLVLLKKNFGAWEWNEEDEVVEFHEELDDSVVDEYNAATDMMIESSERQAEIDEELIELGG